MALLLPVPPVTFIKTAVIVRLLPLSLWSIFLPIALISGVVEGRNKPTPTVELVIIKSSEVVRTVREDSECFVGLSNTVVKLSEEIDARFSQDLPATVLLAVLPSALIEN